MTVVLLLSALLFLALGAAAPPPKAIIIDTDIFSDVDDIGALAVANSFQRCGLVDIKGVMVNTRSRYGALAASVVNTYFGNDRIPIAAMRPLSNEIYVDLHFFRLGEYASKLAHHWPHNLKDASETRTPTELYHSILSSATNKSITIISIGFLSNLAALLSGAGANHNGQEILNLVEARVAELVVMGGQYPDGWEYNFGGVDKTSTKMVIDSWPKTVPITYSGVELGQGVISGGDLQQCAPSDSPILAAYEWYVGRCSTLRESWDPLSVLYGILGLQGLPSLGISSPFAYANDHGYNSFDFESGSNSWVNDSSIRNQHWLKLADGVTNISVASMLNDLYTIDGGSRICGATNYKTEL